MLKSKIAAIIRHHARNTPSFEVAQLILQIPEIAAALDLADEIADAAKRHG